MESEGKLVPDGHAGPFRDAVILVTFFPNLSLLEFHRQNPCIKNEIERTNSITDFGIPGPFPKNPASRCRQKRSRAQAKGIENKDNLGKAKRFPRETQTEQPLRPIQPKIQTMSKGTIQKKQIRRN